MELVYFLLPAALTLAIIGLSGFIWAVRSGQLQDLDTPARRILFDGSDEIPEDDNRRLKKD
jgi:cbb3-type cytochrome oxidase maturation protein